MKTGNSGQEIYPAGMIREIALKNVNVLFVSKWR